MQPNGQIIIAANIIQTQMHLEEDTTEDDFQKDKSQGQGIPGVVRLVTNVSVSNEEHVKHVVNVKVGKHQLQLHNYQDHLFSALLHSIVLL